MHALSRLRALVALTAALALLTVQSPVVADESATITVDDVARLRGVVSVQISPDGGHVAYVLSVPRIPGDDDNGPSYGELHVVDADGKSRPFVTGKVNVGGVRWTPDGKSICFLAKRGDDEHRALYVIPVDGGEARRMVTHDTGVGAYAWSPDGKSIAFLATEKDDKDYKKLKDDGFAPEVYEEEVKPSRIWIADADFDADNEPRMIELKGSASEIHFSPDGSKLVTALAPTSLIDHFYMYRKIHVIDVATGEIVATVDNVGKLGAIRWSPDGSTLAFLSGEDINDPSEGRLMVAAAGGGAPREVMKDYLPNISAIAWQDRETVMFVADDGCESAMGEVNVTTGERKIHVPPGGPILNGLSLSKNGQSAAFVGSSPQHPGEVFISTHTNKKPHRLTDSNPWLADKRLAKQEVIRYKARDGEMIEGVLIHPLDEQPGVRYPLILAVHGGPESRIPNTWLTRYSYPGQIAAAQGIASFYPNYRGSTGRGVAFAKAHQADYGGKEFNDLIDAIDHLVEIGLVDNDKVGVTGGSYGGFATAWCSTFHSERFAAGVMFVGISNQISKSGTTDIADEMFHVHARKRIWDDWQFFLERSPIYYVEKARTPLLILHGKEDTRVHPSQSMELYRHIKTIGKTPVRLVFYPGEGHGNRKAASRYDYNLRSLRWLTHYLKGPGGDPPPYKIDYGLDDEDEDAQATDDDSKEAA